MVGKNPEMSNARELRAALESLVESVNRETLSAPRLRKLRTELAHTLAALQALDDSLDPVTQPNAMFDPANPNVVGAFIALALQSRPRVPLSKVFRFYGAGVYAIYYTGPFPVYSPLSHTEHPIYTGKSDPASAVATTPVEQGEKLSGRLNEHAKNIGLVENIDLADFECRYLVVQSGWQSAAERFLIDWFKPVWNNEIKLCFGIGKHGDSSTTRGNLRSPWDTMHPGRRWAHDDKSVADKKSVKRIDAELRDHFAENLPLTDQQTILRRFFQSIGRA